MFEFIGTFFTTVGKAVVGAVSSAFAGLSAAQIIGGAIAVGATVYAGIKIAKIIKNRISSIFNKKALTFTEHILSDEDCVEVDDMDIMEDDMIEKCQNDILFPANAKKRYRKSRRNKSALFTIGKIADREKEEKQQKTKARREQQSRENYKKIKEGFDSLRQMKYFNEIGKYDPDDVDFDDDGNIISKSERMKSSAILDPDEIKKKHQKLLV